LLAGAPTNSVADAVTNAVQDVAAHEFADVDSVANSGADYY